MPASPTESKRISPGSPEPPTAPNKQDAGLRLGTQARLVKANRGTGQRQPAAEWWRIAEPVERPFADYLVGLCDPFSKSSGTAVGLP